MRLWRRITPTPSSPSTESDGDDHRPVELPGGTPQRRLVKEDEPDAKSMHEHASACKEGVDDDPPPSEVTTTTAIAGAGVADAVTPHRSSAGVEPPPSSTFCHCMTRLLQASFCMYMQRVLIECLAMMNYRVRQTGNHSIGVDDDTRGALPPPWRLGVKPGDQGGSAAPCASCRSW